MLYPRTIIHSGPAGSAPSKNLSRNRFDGLDAEALRAAHKHGFLKLDRTLLSRASGVSKDVISEWIRGRSVSEAADAKIRAALRFGGRGVAAKVGL